MTQVLFHLRDIGEQLLLLLRKTVRALLTPLIFNKIEMLKARLRVPMVGGINRHRKHGTGRGQSE